MVKFTLRCAISIMVIVLTCAACQKEKSQPPQTQTPAANIDAKANPHAQPDGIPAPAWEAYKAARRAIAEDNYIEARRQLMIAVQEKPDFTEAWYNLGATNGNLAIDEMAQKHEQSAVLHFREAVDQKKRAQALIAEGKWFVYKTPAEQAMVQHDLTEALRDADEVLRDERSLITALKLMAAFRNQ